MTGLLGAMLLVLTGIAGSVYLVALGRVLDGGDMKRGLFVVVAVLIPVAALWLLAVAVGLFS